MSEQPPAMIAAQGSWRAVQARSREDWLGLMADDITIEDPIGVAPTNPTGEGFRGKAAAEQFWDKNLAPTESVTITTHESFCAGNESAHRMTLLTKFPNGMQMTVNGIFTYTVNDEGLLTALRGYWSMDESTFEKA